MNIKLGATRLDTTTPDDAANGIRRHVSVTDTGEWGEHISMGGADELSLEPETTHELRLPERWR